MRSSRAQRTPERRATLLGALREVRSDRLTGDRDLLRRDEVFDRLCARLFGRHDQVVNVGGIVRGVAGDQVGDDVDVARIQLMPAQRLRDGVVKQGMT
jgi:hypothetical protein